MKNFKANWYLLKVVKKLDLFIKNHETLNVLLLIEAIK